MLTIELGDMGISRCDCCGATMTNLARFVYEDGDAFAVYYASFTEGHEDRRVRAIISIGGWDEEVVSASRVAVALTISVHGDSFAVRIVDAAASQWNDVALLGRMLTRDEALAHPWIADVYHISDHMLTDDPPVCAFLGNG